MWCEDSAKKREISWPCCAVLCWFRLPFTGQWRNKWAEIWKSNLDFDKVYICGITLKGLQAFQEGRLQVESLCTCVNAKTWTPHGHKHAVCRSLPNISSICLAKKKKKQTFESYKHWTTLQSPLQQPKDDSRKVRILCVCLCVCMYV